MNSETDKIIRNLLLTELLTELRAIEDEAVRLQQRLSKGQCIGFLGIIQNSWRVFYLAGQLDTLNRQDKM